VRFEAFAFGSIRVDGVTYEHDVIIDGGKLRKRSKKASKHLRERYGHTPLSIGEDIPWTCRRLVVGTGADGALPVLTEVTREAKRRGVELVALPTPQALELLRRDMARTNAILHVTC
jgi:hypothetical protein